jgi:phasin family protein
MSSTNQNTNTNQNNGNRLAQQRDSQDAQQRDSQEQIASADATTTSFAGGFQAIAKAYGDYTKKSFEDTKSFVERLSGARSLDTAIEIQTDFAKSAFETFVAESQKIGALYRDLAKQSYKPFGGLPAKMPPTNR